MKRILLDYTLQISGKAKPGQWPEPVYTSALLFILALVPRLLLVTNDTTYIFFSKSKGVFALSAAGRVAPLYVSSQNDAA